MVDAKEEIHTDQYRMPDGVADANLQSILQRSHYTPFEVIDYALSYLRAEDGSMENKDIIRIMKLMLTDASDA
jgi:hypothetical protein